MSSFNYTNVFELIPDRNANTSFNSNAFNITGAPSVSIHIIITGVDVVGSLQFQVSNDRTNFVNEGNPISVTASGDQLIATYVYSPYCRVAWTYTSGTGNISATIYTQPVIVGNQV